jgi:tRNA-specific 2-thiouridylase
VLDARRHRLAGKSALDVDLQAAVPADAAPLLVEALEEHADVALTDHLPREIPSPRVPVQEKATIVVALSGGVDSATAAAILVDAGHRVIGMSMRLHDPRGTAQAAGGRCCGPRDLEDARRVAAHLGIPFYVADYEEEFRRAVIDDFVAEYAAGRTPNPCVRCNERIKFRPLLARARALGASRLATGHYARIVEGRLLRAVDAEKDQSYFLFALPSAELGQLVFPLGGLTKAEVRARARAYALPNADKPESQEICFVPDGDHAAFVERHATVGDGELVDVDGRVVGRHRGVHRFTVGQRRGLGRSLGPTPSYVVSVDALRRRVTVGGREDAARREAVVADVRWTAGRPPAAPVRAGVQVRHRHRAAAAEVVPEGGSARVVFDRPEWAVAPGQAAVFYDGPVVLGGGWIQ